MQEEEEEEAVVVVVEKMVVVETRRSNNRISPRNSRRHQDRVGGSLRLRMGKRPIATRPAKSTTSKLLCFLICHGTEVRKRPFFLYASFYSLSSLRYSLQERGQEMHHLIPFYTLICFASTCIQTTDPAKFPEEFGGVILGGKEAAKKLHPAVLELGYRYASGQVKEENARCRAMMDTFCQVVDDYEGPAKPGTDFRHDLVNAVLKPSFTHWTSKCKPHNTGMGNAFTFLKSAVSSLDRESDLPDAKAVLRETIRAYVRERIDFAGMAIAKNAAEKIVDGDVILTYGESEVIRVLLQQQRESDTRFRVIIVDSKPLLEGKAMLRQLVEAGIDCTYILLNSVAFVMKEVTKVFLGATSLMSDGSVLARVGTACVALAARGKPVLVCAETYKIANRVQLESITHNEMGNPNDVIGGEDELPPNLRVINILYDLTPSSFVSAVVTEMGILPPTSVAVLLREMNPQDTTDAGVL